MADTSSWEERYARTDNYLFGTATNVFLAAQAHLLKPGMSALTLADGEGRNGVWLAERGLDVLAVDFAPSALRKAQALAERRGARLRFEQADLGTWDWPDASFDLVAAIFIQFSDPPQRQKIFAGIKRCLKPGGLLLMQGYRPEHLAYKDTKGGPPVVERCYTRALLDEAFSDFQSVAISEHDSRLEEGDLHVGMSALIDMVARK
jgi:SAM-dependent methyltransferase